MEVRSDVLSRTRGHTQSNTYRLRCLDTGDVLTDRNDPDDPFPLVNPRTTRPSFLRTEYSTHTFRVEATARGLFRFSDFLPISSELPGSSAPVTWKSQNLARKLGLKNLFITFTGYYPDRGAESLTGTFKENEAYSVFGRLGADAFTTTLVVASAGNTARAFLRVAGENELPLLVVVPEKNLTDIWTVGSRGRSTIVVAVGNGGDYTDAIHLAGTIAALPGYRPEGGAKNVARRDGMGCTYLSAAHEIGDLPDHYVQAVGSGTGAIAAWEANLRLAALPSFTDKRTKLHLAQNAPFTLLVDSWRLARRELAVMDDAEAKERINGINARVLANRTPPYGPVGGLYDALTDSAGEMYAIGNEAASRAAAEFYELEGIDPSPAAAVACAALVTAVDTGRIKDDESVMLNVTGGGYRRISREQAIEPVMPDLILNPDVNSRDEIATALEAIKKR